MAEKLEDVIWILLICLTIEYTTVTTQIFCVNIFSATWIVMPFYYIFIVLLIWTTLLHIPGFNFEQVQPFMNVFKTVFVHDTLQVLQIILNAVSVCLPTVDRLSFPQGDSSMPSWMTLMWSSSVGSPPSCRERKGSCSVRYETLLIPTTTNSCG